MKERNRLIIYAVVAALFVIAFVASPAAWATPSRNALAQTVPTRAPSPTPTSLPTAAPTAAPTLATDPAATPQPTATKVVGAPPAELQVTGGNVWVSEAGR